METFLLPRAKPLAPRWLKHGSVPSLDGLRAVSIFLVLLAHHPLPSYLGGFSGDGDRGVEVFFVISGFLITLLLLREQDATGTISLRGFYLRRAFRILPAYATYLLVLWFLTLRGSVHLQAADWLGAVTYTVNFMTETTWEIGHIWSLSLEEHFYLLWPFLFLLGRRLALGWVVACLIAMPLFRFVAWVFFGNQFPFPIHFCTLTRLDTIAVGCALAFLAQKHHFRAATAASPWRLRGFAAAAVVLLVISVWLSAKWYRFKLLFGFSMDSVALGLIVWACINQTSGFVHYVLNARPVAFVGKLSYSLYLWQQLFLRHQETTGGFDWLLPLGKAFLAALASYYVVERPFLKWKDSLQRKD